MEHYYVERAAYHRRPGGLGDVGEHSGTSQEPRHTTESTTNGQQSHTASEGSTIGPEYHSIMYAASNVELPDHQDGQGSE